MYGYDILCGISKVPFEIQHKISYPYIERYDCLYTIERALMCFWPLPCAFHNIPPIHHGGMQSSL